MLSSSSWTSMNRRPPKPQHIKLSSFRLCRWSMAIILTPGINSKKGWHKRHCDFQSVPDACLYYFSHHAMLIFILVLLVIIPASLGFPVDDDVTNDSLGNYSLRGKSKILLSFVFNPWDKSIFKYGLNICPIYRCPWRWRRR